MGLPDIVALKFGAYTLACHHFTAHLSDLSAATRRDRRWTVEACCAVFDEVLTGFFKHASPANLPEAASQLAGLLRSQADLFRRNSPASAAVFDRVAAAMTAEAPGWNYATDIQRMHNLGRDLARRFYADSPYAITQERCRHECQLEFAYGLPDEEGDGLLISTLSFGYRAAPVTFRPQSKDIIVRFTLDDDLALYLAYPFLFLHEYTAHIYATDYGNDRFNDGWMLHVADAFLRRRWNAADPLVTAMPRQQVTIFGDHFYGIIKEHEPVVGRACQFAREFDGWLANYAPGRFDTMTYELAAFERSPGRGKNWPTIFLNSLEQEFEQNRTALQDRIRLDVQEDAPKRVEHKGQLP